MYDFDKETVAPVSYTHLRAHETVLDLVCRLLLEKKKNTTDQRHPRYITSTPTILLCKSGYELITKIIHYGMAHAIKATDLTDILCNM